MATSGNDTIIGTTSNDYLDGLAGNDILNGYAGNDTLYGGVGNDTLYGGDGNDLYLMPLGTGTDLISDTSGTDTILLSDPNNLYVGLDIYRSGSNLVIDALSTGKATIQNEFSTGKVEFVKVDGWATFTVQNGLIGTTSNDLIVGTSAAESLSGNSGDDWIWANAGNDTVNGGLGYNELHGGSGNDSLTGGSDSDDLYSDAGNDTLSGGSGWDDACYDNGQSAGVFVNLSGLTQAYDNRLINNNQVYETASKTVDTLSSIEAITGSAYGDYVILGRTDNNTEIHLNRGNDTVVGGVSSFNYSTTVDYSNDPAGIVVNFSNQALAATLGTTTYYVGRNAVRDGWGNTDTYILDDSSFQIQGSDYNDYIRGRDDTDSDHIYESFDGGKGNDTINGGTGVDSVNYDSDDHPYGIVVNLSAAAITVNSVTINSGKALDCWHNTDTLINIENIFGSNLNDYILGSAANNQLDGGTAGNDTINGGAGNDNINGRSGNDSLIGGDGSDWISGGTGVDWMSGGTGNDTFDFNSISESGITSTTWDTISDFVRGQDKIDLSTIDANTATTTTNEAFSGLIASTTAFSVAGQLKLVGNVLYGNTDTDSTAEFAIQLTGISTLANSDLIL